MKRKTLSSILVIGLICTSLTGCVSFSYGNPVKEETYVAELPDGEVVVLDKEEAEELQRAQDELQKELGISDEELEALREDIAGYEDEETVEEVEEVPIEEQKPFNLSEELGSKVGTTKALGIKYEIYKNGAVIEEVEESFATIPEEIEYEGANYPVTGLGDIHEEWTDFTIPTHIKYIMDKAFSDSSIKNLEIPETVIYMSGTSTFSNSSIEEIVFPSNLRTDSEWNSTFANCINLKSIVVPNDVTKIFYTFKGCTNITNIQLPLALETLAGSAFGDCINLTELSLPNTLTSMPDREIFSGSGIKNIILPDSLIEIDTWAFNGSNVEEIIIPDSVTKYSSGDNIKIKSCPNLKKIKYSNSADYNLYGFDECSTDSELTIIFPDTLTDLHEDHFKGLSSMKLTIHVPANTVDYFQNKFPDITVVAKE